MGTDWAELARAAATVVFALVALLSARVWRQVRTSQGAWLAAAFAAVAFVLVHSRLRAAVELGGPLGEALSILGVGALLAFPYLLFRFAAAFRPRRSALQSGVHLVSLAFIASALLRPWFPQAPPQPAWFSGYVFSVLVYWTLLSLLVAVWLVRAGRDQPLVSRKRMRAMGIASLVLSLALLIAINASGESSVVISQSLGIVAAGLFVLGFSPPRFLRELWRRGAMERLRDAESRLMAATSRTEVADILLPHAADLLGGGGAGLFGRDSKAIAAHDMTDDDIQTTEDTLARTRPRDSDYGRASLRGGILLIPLRSGWLTARSSPYAPFFGLDEVALVERLALLVDLAWGRIELFEAERELRNTLQRTNAELEAILYGLSHDLRGPLLTVLGYLDVLEADYRTALDDQGQHFLDRMRSSAVYMDTLIRDLLEFSRIGHATEKVDDVDLHSLVREITDEITGTRPRVRIDVEPLPVVTMAPARARQLFTNLLENAVRHSGRQEIQIHVFCDTADDGSSRISVIDNGRGIPPDQREKVFALFEQLPGERERIGTGVGLAICRKILEQAGGHIEAVDPPGAVGTCMLISLPAVIISDRQPSQAAP